MTDLVLIMADQLRADALGSAGNPAARTPHLDALAARGMRFRDHLTPNQICSPSRGTLFSGRYARRHGLVHNGIALPADIELLPHALARAGWRTHGVGKFHFQPILAAGELAMPDSNAFWRRAESANWRGPFYGFDTVDILIGESVAATDGGHYARWLAGTAPQAIRLYGRDHALAPPPDDLDEVWKCAVPEHLHYNTWIADRACDAIRQTSRHDRLFLYVSFPDPHHPFTPPAPWCDLVSPVDVTLPDFQARELDRMPDYIARDAGAEARPRTDGKSYVEFLTSPGAPREQGFMRSTEGISAATLRLAIAHTHGAIAMIDHAVGRILAALGDADRLDDTIIVFTSDHGELLGDHGLLRKGPPPYRQLLQVPLLMAGPGVAHGVAEGPTSHVDLKATLLDLLDVDGDFGDGHSFASAVRNLDDEPRAEILAEYHPRIVADQYNQTLITRDWRLTVYPRRSDWGELFDRQRDAGEHRNLFHERHLRSIREGLCERLGLIWPPAPDAGGPKLAVY
ncbi:MAG: arylsulfatase [Alphaproteobacteria bacterium]|nr:arylsulfatase [Alphaproteobacteria bacterium]